MSSLKRLALRLATLALALLLAAEASAAGRRFLSLYEADPSVIAITSGPSLNNQGQAVFAIETPAEAIRDNATLLRTDGATVDTIAEAVAGLTPYRIEGFARFPVINNHGDVAFNALSFTEGDGVFTGPDPLQDAIVTANGPFSGFGNSPALNDSGQVLFQAARTGGLSGLYSGPDPVADLLVDNTGGFSSFSRFELSNAGDVVFVATLDDGTVGLFGGSDPVTDRIVDSSGPFGTFFAAPRLNESGDLVFLAQLDSGELGLFTGPDPATDTLVDTSGDFEQLGIGYLSDRGDFFFVGVFGGGRIGLFEGTDIENDRIIATGDVLFDSVVVEISGNRAFNDLGQVAFSYLLEDGRRGIALADPDRPGDYNRDGLVDLADYTRWAQDSGDSPPVAGLGADGNSDGAIDAADYTVWRDHLSQAPVTVPEPASPVIFTALALVGVGRRPTR